MRREVRQIVVVNFDRFQPLNKTVSAEVRAGGPLKWVRWDTDAHRDPVLLDLPREERWLWPVLLGLAGKERRQADGSRVIHMTPSQLAREADLAEAQVEHALVHLVRHDRIGVSRGGRAGGEDHREGGADHPQGGHVPTDLRTHVPTDRPTRGSEGEARARSNGHDLQPALQRIRTA